MCDLTSSHHGVSFVAQLCLVYFCNLKVLILFTVLYLSVCVHVFVSVFEHAGLGGGVGVDDVAFGVTRTLCVVCALVCVEERGRVTRHGSGQECAMWVGCTIEPDSLRVVNGTGVTPLHLPCCVMTTTQRYSCQVLLTTTVNTHTL